MRTNPLVKSDSYKIGHSYMYPPNMNYMFDYLLARKGGKYPESVFFGLQMFIKDCLQTPFTQEDIDEAAKFYAMHFGRDDVFNKDMFQYILDTYDGFFPVKIKAVPEGTVVPENNVLCTFECSDPKCASIVSFLETMATSYIWYGTTVATNSYQMKETIKFFLNETSTDIDNALPFALHDFGARGVIPGGQAIGGAAHLVNFLGSDTLEGVYAAEKYYGTEFGMPGFSIPATEHSVMCSEGRDGEMIVAQRVFDKYATEGGIIAMVNDTYDMYAHVAQFAQIFKEKYQDTGVRWVTRPDSGNPPEVVIACLRILWSEFGGEINEKGYKVLNPQVRVIQGDGIDPEMLQKVMLAVQGAGFSTENVAVGSGGGLLQKVDRDTLRFAMKASRIEVDGNPRDVYKDPVTQTGDYSKKSLKGNVTLYRDRSTGKLFTGTIDELGHQVQWGLLDEILETVYDGTTKYFKFLTFDEVRENAQ